MMAIIYRGKRLERGCAVTWRDIRDTQDHQLDPRHDLANHSPHGFEWGYGGSGPSQLALAILAHHFGHHHDPAMGIDPDGEAMGLYQAFKWKVIARLPHAEWTITTEQIEACIHDIITQRKLA